ncbi:ion channel [uncultured Ramlibacter sp.]|uniref:ion channel n=1 Tax=uncultured Ramlibacter sp. TaxID=260755 RepID=UPI002623543E|nr:ion channel [uncultured Ramlibacter sp.]
MIFTVLLVGLPVMLLCLILEVFTTWWCIRMYIRQVTSEHPPGIFIEVRPLLTAMLAMTAATLVQILIWATLFLLLGEFSEFYEAAHHSAVNFTSLGYGDFVMAKRWKLLGPLEALNGVLMLGMTASSLMAILQHMIRTRSKALSA